MSDSRDRQDSTTEGSTGSPSGDDGAETGARNEPGAEGGDDADISDALSELERVESKRRGVGVVIGIGAIAVVVGAILLAAEFRQFLFQPKMPIEENERKIVQRTDDPECRELISEITEIGNQYYVLESEIEKTIPGDDVEAIRKLDRKLVTLQERLDEAEKLSQQANLRYENSRKQLEKWYSYVDYEFDILRDVIHNQLDGLESGPPSSDAGPGSTEDADAAGSDAGRTDAGASGIVSTAEEQERTPAERRDGAMVELHDAFENFRVWHSGETHKHPCGDDGEGEQPWRPDDWERRSDASSNADGG